MNWVFLEIPVKNYIVGMLSTCPFRSDNNDKNVIQDILTPWTGLPAMPLLFVVIVNVTWYIGFDMAEMLFILHTKFYKKVSRGKLCHENWNKKTGLLVTRKLCEHQSSWRMFVAPYLQHSAASNLDLHYGDQPEVEHTTSPLNHLIKGSNGVVSTFKSPPS